MALNLGGAIRLTYLVKDAAGAAANPSAATLAITQPDGTVAAGTTITLPPAVTGTLVYDFAPTQAGLHSVHWATTGPTTAEDDMFIVEATGRMLVSVDEAVSHLRASGVITSDADREQLQTLCLEATDIVERDLGRVIVRRIVTETHTGGSAALVLRSTPVLSVTSVTASGVLLDPSAYLLDGAAGILYAGSTYASSLFTVGQRNVTVVYVAGYADPPRVTRTAAKQLVQSMYQQSQQASHPLLDESGAEAFATAALPGLNQIPGYSSLRVAGVA